MGTAEPPPADGAEPPSTQDLQAHEAEMRSREAEVRRATGAGAADSDAAEGVGDLGLEGQAVMPEPEIDQLGRVAHDVRIDVRVLSEVMADLHARTPAERAAALEAVASTTAPRLEWATDGTAVRTVDVSHPAHLPVAGASLAFRAAGEGPVLLLIMGHAGTMAAWDPAFVTALALRGHRVTMFDNRGAGLSSGPVDPELTIAGLADDAAGLLDALGVDRADVLGWSMGGYVAQELALRHPGRVRSLVLVATDAGGADEAPASPDARVVLDQTSPSDEALVRISFPPTDAGRAAAVGWMTRVGMQPGARPEWFVVPPEVVAAQSHAEGPGWAAPGMGTRDRLGRMSVPTLVVAGAEDVVCPVENSRALADGIPGALLRVYEGCGHAVLFHDPERVARDVGDFLHENATP